jgi:hypothetical protein
MPSAEGDADISPQIGEFVEVRGRRWLVEGHAMFDDVGAVRRACVTYRHSAGVGTTHQRRQQLLPQRVREIAWKAQSRLCARYRRLAAKGKRNTVVITAIAREIAAFLWAIAREVEPAPITLQTT